MTEGHTYNRAHHCFLALTAGATFVLIVAGALVTSNDAGLAVPDWPTSFGRWPVTYSYFQVRMVGGVLYEHGHRMVAQLIGILTIILAIWTWRTEGRSWMRTLGWTALATVIAQGVLGGLTVLFYLPAAVSSAHATLGQTFLCILVAMTVMTSRRWVESAAELVAEKKHPRLRTLALMSVAAVYLQLILGAAFRHSSMRLLPHMLSAVLVTALLLWTITRVLSQHSQITALRRPALALLVLLVVQLALGVGSYLTRVEWGKEAPQPMLSMVATTVAHVAVGALVLAATVVLALRAFRHTAPQQETVLAPEPSADKAVMA